MARNTQCTNASALGALDYTNVVKGQITALREVSVGGHNFHCDDTCRQNQTEDGDRHARLQPKHEHSKGTEALAAKKVKVRWRNELCGTGDLVHSELVRRF